MLTSDQNGVALQSGGDARYQQIWQAALGDLQTRISRANFETWLRSTTLVGLANGTATIAVPNTFAAEQLRSKFDHEIAGSLSTIVNRTVSIEYVVSHSGGEATRAARPRVMREPPPVRPAAPTVSSAIPRPASQQLELTSDAAARVGLNPSYTFDSFVVGPSNRLAHAAAIAVADKPAQAFNP